MIEGTTTSGFHYAISEEALDDQELLDALIELDEGNGRAYKQAITMLLGAEQKKDLYEFLRNKNTKRVSARAVADAFKEILTDANEKSQSVKN